MSYLQRKELALSEGLGLSDLVTVCAECGHASCWMGELMCEKAKEADITTKKVVELLVDTGEHPSWWARSIKGE